jgi:hypothetical protein
VQYLYVEGGAETAAAFLAADLVDELHLYTAPILIGDGPSRALARSALPALPAHGRWPRPSSASLAATPSPPICAPATDKDLPPMFTGIVTAIGTIAAAEQRGDLRLRITAPLDPARIDIGASIACSGVCLTVVERGGTAGDAWFDVDLSGETVSRTVPGMWNAGATLNLEPSLGLATSWAGISSPAMSIRSARW